MMREKRKWIIGIVRCALWNGKRYYTVGWEQDNDCAKYLDSHFIITYSFFMNHVNHCSCINWSKEDDSQQFREWLPWRNDKVKWCFRKETFFIIVIYFIFLLIVIHLHDIAYTLKQSHSKKRSQHCHYNCSHSILYK